MTTALDGLIVSQQLEQVIPAAVEESDSSAVWVVPEKIADVAQYLKNDSELAFNYLNAITAVDYVDHFEVIYHLTSLNYNHSVVLKVRVYGREAPAIPSVVSVWKGADFQEREIWDLMGIRFDGHPNLKRIMLWEGFPGHPLRRDFKDDRGQRKADYLIDGQTGEKTLDPTTSAGKQQRFQKNTHVDIWTLLTK